MSQINTDAIRACALPILESVNLHLYDVEVTGTGRSRTLRVLIQSDSGVGIDEITDATRALDEPIDALIEGPFLLEISSPGLERPLRRPEHFATALGETISVKFRDETNAVRRERGQLCSQLDDSITVELANGSELVIALDSITAAHTVFEWGPAPRPGKPAPRTGSNASPIAAQRTKENTRS